MCNFLILIFVKILAGFGPPSSNNCRNSPFCTIYVLGGLFIAACLGCLITLCVVESRVLKTQLGIAGDVIIAGEAESWLNSGWHVKECLKSGDYYKINALYVAQESDLIMHNYTDTYQSRELFQSRQSRETGMINTPGIYLLKGSIIDYTICIATDTFSEKEGKLYVFDNRDDFWKYLDESDDGEQTSVYMRDLPIGVNNHSICTQITFSVPKASYHYVTAKTPGNVLYNFTAIIHAFYLNSSDYEQHCQVSGSESCDVEFQSSFTDAKYVLLAYIHPILPYAPEPLSTHLCVSRKGWFVLPMILEIFIGLIFLFLISIVVFHLFKFLSNRKRRGYIPIAATIQEY